MTATFASLGLPGLAGFISEFMVFRGAFATTARHLGDFGLGYRLWRGDAVVESDPKSFARRVQRKMVGLKDMERFEIVTLAPLLFLMVLVGVYPSSVLDTINTFSVALLSAQVLV